MADNTRMNPGADGDLIATDLIADGGVADGAKVERTKAGHGPDGEYRDPCLEFPFPAMPASMFMAEIVAGRVPGYSGLDKFGQNTNLTKDIPADIWDGGGIYDWMTAAAQLEVVSTSANDTAGDIGANTIRVFGLDASFNQINEDIIMDGSSPVFTVNSYYRVFRSFVLTAGSAGSAVGDIMIQDIGGAGSVRAQILLGNDQTQMALYTVPAGKTLFIIGVFGSIYNAISKGYGEMEFRVRNIGGVFREQRNTGLATEGTTSLVYPQEMPVMVEEKSDILMRATVTVSGTLAIGQFAGFMKDN